MQTYQIELDKGLNSKSILSEDAIVREEFSFKPLVQFQRPLKLTRCFSYLISLCAIYQLTYGAFSFSYLPSSFNLALTILGLLSFILSIFLTIWSARALKVESDKTLLTQDTIDKALEQSSRILQLSMIFRVATSSVMIPVIISQGTQTVEHLLAHDITYNTPEYSTTVEILKNLAIPLPFFELFGCMAFMYAAWVCFSYAKSSRQLMNILVSLSNLIFMASSLALVYTALSIEKNFENLLVSSLMPRWNISGLKYAGIIAGVMTGFIWLVNFKRWRAPSFLVIGLMTILVFSLSVLTVKTYASANTISEFYQDTTDMNIWSSKMWNANEKAIETFGCPAKYLPYGRCQGSLLVNRWEQELTDSQAAYCLNSACSDILGSLYSSPFLKLSTLALASIVSGLIVIAGSLYLSMTNFRDTIPHSKKDYGWLGILIAMAVIFTIAINMPTSPLISEKGLSFEGLFQAEENKLRSAGYDRWFGGSGIEIDSNLSKMISRMFLLKENRFIRMKLNKDYNRAVLTQAGDYSLQYQDLLDSLNPDEAEIALVRVPIDNKSDAIVGIVWIPPSISPIERETYLRYYAINQTDPRSQRLGFPVYVATGEESLHQDIVMPNVLSYRTVLLEDEYLEVNEQQEIITVLMSAIPFTLELSKEDGQDLFNMVMSKSYKFLVLGLDLENEKAVIEAKGDWESSYDDFIQNFHAGEATVGLIYLEVDGQTRLTVIVLENDSLAQKRKSMSNDTITDVKNVEKMQVYFYITKDPAELAFDSLMKEINQQAKTAKEAAQPSLGC